VKTGDEELQPLIQVFVYTFATIFDSSGKVIEVGGGDIGRIYRLGKVVDKLQSKWSQKDIILKEQQREFTKRSEILSKIFITKSLSFFVSITKSFFYQNLNHSKWFQQKRGKERFIHKHHTFSHYSFQQRLLNKIKELSRTM